MDKGKAVISLLHYPWNHTPFPEVSRVVANLPPLVLSRCRASSQIGGLGFIPRLLPTVPRGTKSGVQYNPKNILVYVVDCCLVLATLGGRLE